MLERLKSRWLLAGGILLALILVGGGMLAPRAWSRLAQAAAAEVGDTATAGTSGTEAPSSRLVPKTPATASPPRAAGRQTAEVKRGNISELMPLGGRVAAQEEVTLNWPGAGRIETVAVEPGTAVVEGQVILEAASQDISRQLEDARARLQTSLLRLAQGQSQAQARQNASTSRRHTEETQRQGAIADAEAARQSAEADRAQALRGPTPAELQRAEQEVATARLALQRAEADQAQLSRGADPAELQRAELEVATAQLALQRAEADQERLARGPTPADLQRAEQEVATAQLTLQRAEADQARLARGPDPADVVAAERDLVRAQAALDTARQELDRVTRPDAGAVQAGHTADGSARAARGASSTGSSDRQNDARDRGARVPSTQTEIDAARRSVEFAQLTMDAALDRANSVRRGPDQIAVNSANAAVEAGRLNLLTARANLGALQTPADQLAAAAATTDNARRTLQSAQDRLSALRAGPPGDQLAMASSAVDNARRALQSAQATLGEVQSRPTHAELAELNSRVDRAQTAVQRAQVGVLVDEPDSESLDVQLLERTVDQDRVQVETLERDLAATRVTAPFAGTVSAVLARPGDQPERGRPVVVLAKPGNLIVRADLTEAEADRLAIGQKATVQLEGDDGTPLRATLAEFASTEGDLGRGALFEVSWLQRPTLGSIAQVAVTLQEKADVLLVPQRAVRTAGRRQYVEYLDGTTRRTIDVEVGRVAGGQAEIVSGLTEGQFVLVAP